MHKYLLVIPVLIALASVARAAESNEEARDLLDAARAAWAKHGLTDYSYTLERGGVFGAGPKRRVRVEAGVCVRVTYWWHLSRHQDSCDNRTIPELFDELGREIRNNPVSILLKFDPELGYPLEVTVEPRTDLSDQEWWYAISRFRD